MTQNRQYYLIYSQFVHFILVTKYLCWQYREWYVLLLWIFEVLPGCSSKGRGFDFTRFCFEFGTTSRLQIQLAHIFLHQFDCCHLKIVICSPHHFTDERNIIWGDFRLCDAPTTAIQSFLWTHVPLSHEQKVYTLILSHYQNFNKLPLTR